MGLKLVQNINFRFFFGFSSVFGLGTIFLGRDQVSWSRQFFGRGTVFGVATKFPGHDSLLGRDSFWTVTCFSSPTCRDHNFFVLTWIWACEYSLESSLNVECNHEEF